MHARNPGMKFIHCTETIKKALQEASCTGTSPVLVVETFNWQETSGLHPYLTDSHSRLLSINLHARQTVFSFMEETLWALRHIEPCFSWSITDMWFMEKSGRSLKGVVTAFTEALSALSEPILLLLDHVDQVTDDALLESIVSLAESFPGQHTLVLSGYPVPESLKNLSDGAYLQVDGSGAHPAKDVFADSLAEGDSIEKVRRLGNEALSKGDLEALKNQFISSHSSFIRAGRTWAMHAWVRWLEKEASPHEPALSAALGAYYAATAQHDKAERHLENALEKTSPGSPLHTQVTLEQARWIRRTLSCDSSNDLLDPFIFELEDLSTESAYSWLIEKTQNLLLEDKWVKADELIRNMVTICDIAENSRMKKWYERVMVSISCHYGDLEEAIAHYEQSLELPAEDQAIVQENDITPDAAKAYFATGQTEKAFGLLKESIRQCKNDGRIHKLSAHYLMLGELYFWESLRKEEPHSKQLLQQSAEAVRLSSAYGKYTCPSRENQKKIDNITSLYSFLMGGGSSGDSDRLFDFLSTASSPLNLFFLNAFTMDALKKEDNQQALYLGMYAVEVGEISKQKTETAVSYGLAALASLRLNNTGQATFLVRRFLRVCSQTGCNYLFQIPNFVEPLLQFARQAGIESEFVESRSDHQTDTQP